MVAAESTDILSLKAVVMVSMAIPDRLKRFEIPGRVTLLEGNGELATIEAATAWRAPEIYLRGARVTDFGEKGEPWLISASQSSRFQRGEPIRGGIPIVFPWFGARE